MAGLKRDDRVVIISGDYRGDEGKVLKVLQGGKKVIVEGVNIQKKHVKRQGANHGTIEDVTLPIFSSKVKRLGERT